MTHWTTSRMPSSSPSGAKKVICSLRAALLKVKGVRRQPTVDGPHHRHTLPTTVGAAIYTCHDPCSLATQQTAALCLTMMASMHVHRPACRSRHVMSQRHCMSLNSAVGLFMQARCVMQATSSRTTTASTGRTWGRRRTGTAPRVQTRSRRPRRRSSQKGRRQVRV